MYCPECGAENKSNAKFCEQCGGDVGLQNEGPTGVFGSREKVVGFQDIAADARHDLGLVGRRIAGALVPGQLTDIGLSLLPGEKVIKELSIGFLDRGIWFWRRNLLILTNQRVISYNRKIVDESVSTAHLRDITGVANGTRLQGLTALIGVLIVVFGVYSLVSGLPNGDFLQGLLAIAFGLVIVLLSRQKGLWLSAYNQTIGIQITRLSMTESDEFITALFNAREIFFKTDARSAVQREPST